MKKINTTCNFIAGNNHRIYLGIHLLTQTFFFAAYIIYTILTLFFSILGCALHCCVASFLKKPKLNKHIPIVIKYSSEIYFKLEF